MLRRSAVPPTSRSDKQGEEHAGAEPDAQQDQSLRPLITKAAALSLARCWGRRRRRTCPLPGKEGSEAPSRAWQGKAEVDAADRATEVYQRWLREYEQPPMPDDRRAALDDFMARRIAEGGALPES